MGLDFNVKHQSSFVSLSQDHYHMPTLTLTVAIDNMHNVVCLGWLIFFFLFFFFYTSVSTLAMQENNKYILHKNKFNEELT